MYIFSSRLRQRGAFLVLAAIILPLFLLVAGACVDIGALYIAKGRQQNAADTAALAGAQELPDSDKAVAMARDYLVRNGFSQEIANSATVEILESNTKCRVTFEAPAPLVVFRAFFETGPTIRARAAAIGTKGGGYAIFAGTGRVTGLMTSLRISSNNTKMSGKIHSNNGITSATLGSFTFASAEITCGTNHNIFNQDVSQGVRIPIKHTTKQPFPDRSAELAHYKQTGRYRDANAFTPEINDALRRGEIDGICTSGTFFLPTDAELDLDALRKLRFIIANGYIGPQNKSDFLSLFSYLGTISRPVLLASENGDILIRTPPANKGTFYADIYAPEGEISVQLSTTNFSGSIAGDSVDLQANSIALGSGSGAGGRTLRLVE